MPKQRSPLSNLNLNVPSFSYSVTPTLLLLVDRERSLNRALMIKQRSPSLNLSLNVQQPLPCCLWMESDRSTAP
ncbi:hypothetical protein [Leptolyngbya sp. CCY15150]|uniref:hypothetical protein n=1 Tax=Leptolyngbya sp. CCY15150 TaxID=2767772 RepID=UPI00194FFFAD|nr:hypothetical protein [Leptolyngbya sp. CCY15150]